MTPPLVSFLVGWLVGFKELILFQEKSNRAAAERDVNIVALSVDDVGNSCYALGKRRFGFLWMILILGHTLCHINSRAGQSKLHGVRTDASSRRRRAEYITEDGSKRNSCIQILLCHSWITEVLLSIFLLFL
jgi:hypothetical protein